MFDADPVAGGLLAQRRIMLGGVVDARALAASVSQLMYLDGISVDPVSLVVTGAAGSLEDALGLLDTLRLMRAPTTVDLVGSVTGGPAVALVASSGLRRIGATASLSLRLPASPPSSAMSADALAAESQRRSDLAERVALLLAERSGQTVEWLLDQFDRGGQFTPDQAIGFGLVDELR